MLGGHVAKDKKIHKMKKREKKKREAKENRPTLENNFSLDEKKKGMMQIGIVVIIMIAASAFIFTQM
jgi:hypothetical protein